MKSSSACDPASPWESVKGSIPTCFFGKADSVPLRKHSHYLNNASMPVVFLKMILKTAQLIFLNFDSLIGNNVGMSIFLSMFQFLVQVKDSLVKIKAIKVSKEWVDSSLRGDKMHSTAAEKETITLVRLDSKDDNDMLSLVLRGLKWKPWKWLSE